MQHVEAPHDVDGFRHQRLEVGPHEAPVRALESWTGGTDSVAPVVLHVQRRTTVMAFGRTSIPSSALSP